MAVAPGLSLLSQDWGKWSESGLSHRERACVGSCSPGGDKNGPFPPLWGCHQSYGRGGVKPWEQGTGDRVCSGPPLVAGLEAGWDFWGSGRWGSCHHSPFSQTVPGKWQCQWSHKCGPCFYWSFHYWGCGAAGRWSAGGCCYRQVLGNINVNGKGVPKQMVYLYQRCVIPKAQSTALLPAALPREMSVTLIALVMVHFSIILHFSFTCNYKSLQ